MPGWPSVTVVIPTRDRPTELRHALASILTQDYPGDLVCEVVFDQAEPFDLSDMIPTRSGRTLMVTRNVRTPGAAGARNTGVDASFGDLIAFCDDDDEWLPGKLSTQVEALHADPDAKVVLTGVEIWQGGVRTTLLPDAISLTSEALCRARVTDVHTSTLLVEREACERAIGPFDEACPEGYGEAYEWLLRASGQAPVVVVRDPLVRMSHGGAFDLADRSQAIVDGTRYLLAVHPELRRCRQGISRMEGAVAVAYALLGRRREARRWALLSIRHGPAEKRSYIALAASTRLVGTATIARWAGRTDFRG